MTPSSRFVTAPLLVVVTAMFLAIRPVSIHPCHDNSFTIRRPPKGTRGTVLVGIGNSIRGTRDLELHSRFAGARRFLDVGEDMTGVWYPRQNQKRAGKLRIESSCDKGGAGSVALCLILVSSGPMTNARGEMHEHNATRCRVPELALAPRPASDVVRHQGTHRHHSVFFLRRGDYHYTTFETIIQMEVLLLFVEFSGRANLKTGERIPEHRDHKRYDARPLHYAK